MRGKPSLAGILTLLLLVATQACAGSGGPDAAFHPPTSPRPGCGLTPVPELDGALETAPMGVWISRTLGSDEASVVFSVRRGGTGPEESSPGIRTLWTDLDEMTTDSLAQAVTAHLPPPPEAEPEERWSLRYRLRIDAGPGGPAFRVAPSLECEPRVNNRRVIQRALREAARTWRIPGTTVVLVRVEENGRVSEVRVEESSGNGVLDRDLSDVASRMRFDPAHIDGVPIVVWSRIPLRLQLVP